MIVGIGHVARVGKDSAAAALVRDLQFTRIGFADQLKELAMVADPLVTSSVRTVNTNIGHGHLAWTVMGLGGWEQAKDTYPEVRKFLQRLGDGGRQVFGEDFWVDQLFKKAGQLGRVVIPDVRYENEALAIKDAGGVVIKIDRPGHKAQGHISETALADWDGWDEVFTNAGALVELERDVVAWVRNRLEVKA